VRPRLGPDSDSAVPHSNYETGDGKWVALACSNDKMFARLCAVMHRMDLLERFALVGERLKHRQEVNGIVGDWAAQHSRDELMRRCDAGDVPLGPINSIADIFEDEHIRARKTLETLDVPGEGPVTVPGVVPHLRGTPGRIDTLGPTLGQHNEEVYRDLLGMSATELQDLRVAGII
ncbi:MAG: CoA transferase, partial [Burkholderiales bacterium]